LVPSKTSADGLLARSSIVKEVSELFETLILVPEVEPKPSKLSIRLNLALLLYLKVKSRLIRVPGVTEVSKVTGS